MVGAVARFADATEGRAVDGGVGEGVIDGGAA